MGKIELRDENYKNFGNCKVIGNGLFEMYVTAEIGPRIIKLNLPGKENLMFEDIERVSFEDVSQVFGEAKKWYIYGGHRLWVSPEALPYTYYPDNEPVSVKINGNKVIFTPPPQAVNNLQHSIEIEMCENKSRARVTHKVGNLGDKPVEGAIWALSVMTGGGTVICPQPDNNTELLANRVLALWPYTRFTDPRWNIYDKYITVKQDKNISGKFKFGINNNKGWIAYQNHGQLLKKSYEPNHPDGAYPDYGVSTEIFTNNLFIEAETLGGLHTLNKGEFMTHTETWELKEAPGLNTDNQDKLEEYAEKYII
jgi:putative component of toxin-antitoxin plasmid stabilization module